VLYLPGEVYATVIEFTDKKGKVLRVHDQVVTEDGVVGRLGPLHNLQGTFSVELGVTGTDEWIGKDHSADIEIQAKPTGWVAPVELITEGVPQVRRVKAKAEIEEKARRWIASFQRGDRVEVMDEPFTRAEDAPALYGEVTKEAGEDKRIMVRIDGLQTPLSFYASQLRKVGLGEGPASGWMRSWVRAFGRRFR
jgi:hypothetical protein